MITFLRNLWNWRESRKNELIEKFEATFEKLDLEITKETAEDIVGPASFVKDFVKPAPSATHLNEPSEKTNCFKCTGMITALKTNHGIIDHEIFFEMEVAALVSCKLKVGCRIEFLCYKHPETDHVKVIRIYKIFEDNWNKDNLTGQEIDAKINELKEEKPKYFTTHQRNILGLIIDQDLTSITVETGFNKTMKVYLDTVKIDFVPKKGDRVYMCCIVQSDKDNFDRYGEILEVISVHPSRLIKDEKCTVKHLNTDWGILNQDAYFSFDVLPNACKLNLGDIVSADLIECENGKFVWRCIKLNILERITDSGKNITENHVITLDPDKKCEFDKLFEEKEIVFSCNNNCDRTFRCYVDLPNHNDKSQVRLIDPERGVWFELKPNAKRSIQFVVESKYYGESKTKFSIQFENFKILRSISVRVYKTKARAEAIDQTLPIEEISHSNNAPVVRNRNQMQKLRLYANQVWSDRSEVVPGIPIGPAQRFVANRIGAFEVPVLLRTIYLKCVNKQEMLSNIEEKFPSIKMELCIGNYAARFHTLIHLDEIECFINFRNYDRERAHFTREGEYLSLTIENLSERRPSLVQGDIVRVINPWKDRDFDNCNYNGVIHKVLFDRVLLKFNAKFQQKYNGEAYRLEFFFSRFGYRKQHFALERVVRHLGKEFLFPSNIQLRHQPQLDVVFNKDGDVSFQNTTHKWYNKLLNPIQKRAVFQILRGEIRNMPYILFGPPGTGKTVTLVETVLQLAKHLPSSRLLVGTPSNSSADLITTRLIECGELKPGDLIRLVSMTQVERGAIPEHLMPYCAMVNIAIDETSSDSMMVTESGLKLNCQMKFLGRHRITIGTCSTLGMFLQMNFPADHFTHVLIDEAGHCTEPEVMVAITQVAKNRGQVILAGDPKQLSAVVTNHYAAEKGLNISFLERVLNCSPYLKDKLRYPKSNGYDPRVVTKLLYSYRALPSILHIYNKLFYDSELIPILNEDSLETKRLKEISDLLPDSDARSETHGIFFYGMLSENMQEKDSPSWYNPHEAKTVFLMTLLLYRKNIKPENIGIITPYAKQVSHLRTLFTTADIDMPKIGSVEEYQGQERDIILISTVRSTKHYVTNDIRYSLGFIHNAKRINVAISRARYLLCIFGNPNLLISDPSWRSIIKYCLDNDAYLGCDLPPDMYDDI